MKNLIVLLSLLLMFIPRQLPPHRCWPGEDCRPCAIGENCYIPPACRIGEECDETNQ